MSSVVLSIVIPAYNSASVIGRALDSLCEQAVSDAEVEVLVIDDCSTDNTAEEVRRLQQRFPFSIVTHQTSLNSGPGTARNIGVQKAAGQWVVFLDSDDRLERGALKALIDAIRRGGDDIDLVSFGWRYDEASENVAHRLGGRYDFHGLRKEKKELLKQYASLGMDGSVIYTAMRKSLLHQNRIEFRPGVHEDVDFMFKAYYFARGIRVLSNVLYIKNNNLKSIVNTFSRRHVQGYFGAFDEMLTFAASKDLKLQREFAIGIVGVVVNLVRSALQKLTDNSEAEELLLDVAHQAGEMCRKYDLEPRPRLGTKYGLIAREFYRYIEDCRSSGNWYEQLKASIAELDKKSWSCYDLHHSLFLGPDEIRTCCKRFFVDQKMKGDVVLISRDEISSGMVSPETILKKKQELYTSINRGESEECSGCPFLEFSDWGYINRLSIENLSLEYHSVCNMRCSYCSDVYFGGKKSSYDVPTLLDELEGEGALQSLRTVVWGGGEPLLDRGFDSILQRLTQRAPRPSLRVLTNATKFSDAVARELQQGHLSILTSLDSGTPETFFAVRKNRHFHEVLGNLSRYAQANANKIVVKYILLPENSSIQELDKFVEQVSLYKLLGCSFQISADFKQEVVDPAQFLAVLYLYACLLKEGANIVYIDEHVRQRIPTCDEQAMDEYRRRLKVYGLDGYLADPTLYKSVTIWGAGIQTKVMLEKSVFFRKVKINGIVDSRATYIGSRLFDFEVQSPEFCRHDSSSVVLSASQGTPALVDEYFRAGFDPDRLIRGLIV